VITRPANRAIKQWASKWWIVTKGFLSSWAIETAFLRPTRKHISKPGPFVTAIACISSRDFNPACSVASLMALSILSMIVK
jgi:hypothetical protein